jgi:hypothetical protein
MKSLELDILDKAVLTIAYNQIEGSNSKRVSGSGVWGVLRTTDIAPVHNGARLMRLVSLGLLARDQANSSCRTKVYRPTEAGYRIYHELTMQAALPR